MSSILQGLARPEHVVGLPLGCGFVPKLGREMASILFQTPMTPAYIRIKTISGGGQVSLHSVVSDWLFFVFVPMDPR